MPLDSRIRTLGLSGRIRARLYIEIKVITLLIYLSFSFVLAPAGIRVP